MRGLSIDARKTGWRREMERADTASRSLESVLRIESGKS